MDFIMVGAIVDLDLHLGQISAQALYQHKGRVDGRFETKPLSKFVLRDDVEAKKIDIQQMVTILLRQQITTDRSTEFPSK